MWKSILITLVTLSVVIAALSLVVVGVMKLPGMVLIQLTAPIMILGILKTIDDLSRPVSIILTWILSGNGGLTFIPNSDILE
jgi:hypothetical protein